MLTTSEIDERISRHEREFNEFANEVAWVHRDLVSFHYPEAKVEPLYGFHYTCHGYIMLCFAWIDMLSAYWSGGTKLRNDTGDPPVHNKWSAQTERMVHFLNKYYRPEPQIHRVNVEMWRHTLMHESKPREICDKNGQHYSWQLVWEMSDSDHYRMETISPHYSGKSYDLMVIRIELLRFLGDIREMLDAYTTDLRMLSHIQRNYESRVCEMTQDCFTA